MRVGKSTLYALAAVVATLPASLLATSGCNLVVDANAESCSTDADCVNRPNTACDTEQGVCVSLDKCTSNADCPDDQICRHFSPRACVSLTTGAASDPTDTTSLEPSCTEVYPADEAIWRDDGTLLIGLTAPRSEGGMESSTGISITNGARLAIDEINDKGGINNTTKIAMVVCDDYGESNFAENNGLALADMGVSAMIGPAYSGQTIKTATAEGNQAVGTVERGVLLISPSATSPDVSGIKDKAPACVADCGGDTACEASCPGLVWRTSPSDKIQGDAMVKYFKDLEPIIKARIDPANPITTMKVSVLFKDDSYGKNLSKFVIDGLEFNGKKANQQASVFHARNYGGDTTPLDTSAISATAAEEPDAIIIIGTSETADALQQIEAEWSNVNDATRPYYLFGDGGLLTEVLTEANTLGAAARIRGTIPGTQGGRFDNFAAAYNVAFADSGAPTTFGAAGAYDAVYLLAYSGVAANGKPLTGEELARGLARTADASGQAIDAGPLSFGDASNDLQNDLGINYEGASGPLDFDVQTGEAPSDIQIWCADAAATGPFSGRYYDAKTGTMKGTADPGGTGFSCPF